jgi:hypothetical protein
VDLSLHNSAVTAAKRLTQVMLSGLADVPDELLMEVNNAGELRDSFAWA